MKRIYFAKKVFLSLCFGIFSTYGTSAQGQLYYEWDFLEQPGPMHITGCYSSKEDSLFYYYYNILHFVVLVEYEDTITPIAIVNAYHPTDEPDTQDIQFDPRVQKLKLIPIIGYVSSQNGMWGLYVQDFLMDRPSTSLGENRTPEHILQIVNQIPCPMDVPDEYVQELFDDLED